MKLQPLNKTALSSQLYNLTGKFYSERDFKRDGEKVIELSTGNIFFLPTREEEEQFKAEEEKRQEAEKLEKFHRHDGKNYPFIDYHNPERWKAGLNHLKNEGHPKTEMCEDAYCHFLECVPPLRMKGAKFVCSEPFKHNNQGEAVYLCATKEDGKYFARYGTLKQFDSNQIF